MTTLPFSKVGIDGFRGLRHLELDGLGRINILVGGNNSGKTSVLEALSIICQPYNPDEWLAMIRRRDFGRLDETIIQSLRWCFNQAAGLSDPEQIVKAYCEFKCQGDFPLRGLQISYSEFIGEPPANDVIRSLGSTQALAQFSEPMMGADLIQIPNIVQPLDGSFGDLVNIGYRIWEKLPFTWSPNKGVPGLNCETLTPCSYQLNQEQVRTQSKRIFQQDSPSLLGLLRDFDADVEGIDIASFRGDRPAIYIKHRKLGVAPLSIFGDAMRRAVLLASTLLSLKDGGVLLIDEVEAGIHVGALGRVFEWLVKAARTLNVQVFVTTHSLEALDALVAARPVLDEGDDVVAFHLRQTDEKTHGKRLYGDLLRRLRFERGLDVR